MAEPYIGEIRIVAFTFAPRDYAFCNGQLVAIQQNTALFAILGTTFGGDGQTTFGLPDMRARSPMGVGQGNGLTPRVLGEMLGTPQVTLMTTEMPAHTHSISGATLAPPNPAQAVATPTNTAMFSQSSPGPTYSITTTPPAPMSPQAIGVGGGGQPHPNRQPYLGLNFIIALRGTFPARN